MSARHPPSQGCQNWPVGSGGDSLILPCEVTISFSPYGFESEPRSVLAWVCCFIRAREW